jgi:alkyl hydroperoxide reductase subunit F
MLDPAVIEQLKAVFSGLEADYRFVVEADAHQAREELLDLLREVTATSGRLSVEELRAEGLQFRIEKNGRALPVLFKGIPGGHEFTTLILAVLHADGKGKWPDEAVRKRIQALSGPIRLTSYISQSCVNCPEVVQALNQMALIHPDFEHTMVEGTHFQDEVARRRIQGVPAVFAGERMLHAGQADLSQLLDKLEAHFGFRAAEKGELRQVDVAVIGGGPAGVAAAIYTARKGLKTAIIAERIGGQVNETKGIENMISVAYTEGPQLAASLFKHLGSYPIDVLEHRRVEAIAKDGRIRLSLKGGEEVSAGALIAATGAKWRQLGIPGERENIGRGVAFCPHCDGPFYQNKPVVVVGGGNSGVEAAIDLAGICKSVVLVEYSSQLKADEVLTRKLGSLSNASVMLGAQATAVLDDGAKVVGLRVKDLASGNEQTLVADGIFVQIGLVPNSAPFAGLVELNERGEIVADRAGRTGVPGVYAAGDVTDVPYKQIIISMGAGATAALSVFEDFARGTLEPLPK